ncbi:hypothetical protein CEXT_697301 [Caerostris extrusa]|uniref:Uncharacterized protein n=1 Tax=Caerostris extrusa TaxID=172846 RepID=A0AAV4YDY9_CAEEX|nr:hypothetical protein CEXT_697301 [Caerostris extrusa]
MLYYALRCMSPMYDAILCPPDICLQSMMLYYALRYMPPKHDTILCRPIYTPNVRCYIMPSDVCPQFSLCKEKQPEHTLYRGIKPSRAHEQRKEGGRERKKGATVFTPHFLCSSSAYRSNGERALAKQRAHFPNGWANSNWPNWPDCSFIKK